MKKTIFLLLLSLGLAYGASAQRFGHGFVGGGYYGGGYYPRTYVGVGVGIGYPWGYPYGYWNPYGPYGAYPPYYYGYGAMPNQLELQVRDIKADYEARIKDVKHDKALTHRERRDKINSLKTERDNAIVQARHDYFYNAQRNYNNRNNNGQQPNNGNQNQNQQNQQQPQSGNNNGSSSDGPEYQPQGSNNTSGSR
jgi:hypothetical protein